MFLFFFLLGDDFGKRAGEENRQPCPLPGLNWIKMKRLFLESHSFAPVMSWNFLGL